MPTPFELRLDVLKMARELVCDDWYQRRDAIMDVWRTECDTAQRKGEDNPKLPTIPAFPTEDEIIKKAEALNKFVSTAK